MGVAIVLLALPLRYRTGIADAIRETVLRPFFALQRGTSDRQGRYADASFLRAERDSLAAFLVGQAGLAAENRQLRSLLGFRPRLSYSFVPAEATRYEVAGKQGILLLSVGARDGVQPGMPVVTAEGLVGKVIEAGSGSSTAMDWTNSDFSLALTTEDGRVYGLASSTQDEQGRRVLEFSPNALQATPDSGTLLVTSGDGQTYPRGIPVARVVGPAQRKESWQRSYYIAPLVPPSRATYVLLLGQPSSATADRDLASAWGIRVSAAPPPESATTPPPLPPAGAAARPTPSTNAAAPPRRATEAPAARPRPRGPRLLGRPAAEVYREPPPEVSGRRPTPRQR